MFLHLLSLRVSLRWTLRIRVFFLGYLAADLLAVDVLVPGLRQAGSLQGLGSLSEDSEPLYASALAGQRAAHTRCLAPLRLPWLPRTPLASHHPLRFAFPALASLASSAPPPQQRPGPPQAGMKGYQGQGCEGRRGRASRASRGRWGVAGCRRGRA